MAETEKKEGLGCSGFLGIIVIGFFLISLFSEDDEKGGKTVTNIEENRIDEVSVARTDGTKRETNNIPVARTDGTDYKGNGFTIKFPGPTPPEISRKGNNVLYSSNKGGIIYAIGEINFEPGFANSSEKGKNDWLENHYKKQAGINSFRQSRSVTNGSESMEFSYFNSGNGNITIGRTYVAKKSMYFATTTFPSTQKNGYTNPDTIAFRSGLKIVGAVNQAIIPKTITEVAETKSPTTGKCLIKGNVGYGTSEKIYHLPGDSFYESTVINTNFGEKWFCTENEAIAAGWRHAKSGTNNSKQDSIEKPITEPFDPFKNSDTSGDNQGYYDDYENDDPYENYQEEEGYSEPDDYYDSYNDDGYDGIR